mgnify:CR=1 FL=1
MPIDPRASVAENNTSVTVGSSSTSVLTANPTRKTVILTNDSDESIYVSLSGTAVMNQGIRLNSSGGAIVVDLDGIYTGAITAICSSGSKNLCVSEL